MKRLAEPILNIVTSIIKNKEDIWAIKNAGLRLNCSRNGRLVKRAINEATKKGS